MNILNRYILKQFFYLFAWATAAFLGILLLSDLFQMLKTILGNRVPAGVTSQYLLCNTTVMLVQVIPIAVLLGAIFCLNQLNRFRELTIMKATGLSIYRIITPLLVVSLAISVGVLLLNEFVVPSSARQAKLIRSSQIEKRGITNFFSDISFNEDNVFFYIKSYNSSGRQMKDIRIIERRSDKAKSVFKRTDAGYGIWSRKGSGEYEWELNEVVEWNFDAVGELKDRKEMPGKTLVLRYSPEDFKEKKNHEEMGFISFSRYLKSLKESGNYDARLYVDLFQKLSFPFASFFLAVVGIPFALRSKRSGVATGFGVSIIISFLYWTVMSLAIAWGKELILPPYFATSLPNIICLATGTFMLRRTPT